MAEEMITWRPSVAYWFGDRFVTLHLTNETIKLPQAAWYQMAQQEYERQTKRTK